jgi:hypothetical protein
VHDDIGWTFSDEDAAVLGVNGYDHRRFLNEFYRGRFEGSFARGLPFQENPKTGDCRISGTCASLAGLEKAIKEEGPGEVELAIRRILLIHAVILTAGGIPLLYLGDEIGTRNDYTYLEDPAHQRDSRWVHRPQADWEEYAKRNDPNFVEGCIYQGLQKLISVRKEYDAFSGGELEIIPTSNNHVLGFVRLHTDNRALIFANFSELQQIVPYQVTQSYNAGIHHRLHGISSFAPGEDLLLEPLDFLVLS